MFNANKNFLLSAYNSVDDTSYKWFEIDVMNYMMNNAKVFRLKDVGQEKITGWDSDMEPWFTYIHLIHQRKWCDENHFQELYFNKIYKEIINKYNIDTSKLEVRR